MRSCCTVLQTFKPAGALYLKLTGLMKCALATPTVGIHYDRYHTNKWEKTRTSKSMKVNVLDEFDFSGEGKSSFMSLDALD